MGARHSEALRAPVVDALARVPYHLAAVIQIFGTPKCNVTRAARRFFADRRVDVQFVDEHDQVRFCSEGERIFPRSPDVIGRKVQNCHPPASVHKVQQIIDAFRAGDKDTAELWIELGGRFLHIRYFAVRDAAGAYRGVVETAQDVTSIRALEGQRRLLDW